MFPISAPINMGIRELLSEAASQLASLSLLPEEEDTYLFFDFEKDDIDENYREVIPTREGDVFVLTGKQLEKIFNSTNFNDLGSLRYLYRYIEKSGALEKLKDMGLEEGSIIRVKDFEFEYYDEG